MTTQAQATPDQIAAFRATLEDALTPRTHTAYHNVYDFMIDSIVDDIADSVDLSVYTITPENAADLWNDLDAQLQENARFFDTDRSTCLDFRGVYDWRINYMIDAVMIRPTLPLSFIDPADGDCDDSVDLVFDIEIADDE